MLFKNCSFKKVYFMQISDALNFIRSNKVFFFSSWLFFFWGWDICVASPKDEPRHYSLKACSILSICVAMDCYSSPCVAYKRACDSSQTTCLYFKIGGEQKWSVFEKRKYMKYMINETILQEVREPGSDWRKKMQNIISTY